MKCGFLKVQDVIEQIQSVKLKNLIDEYIEGVEAGKARSTSLCPRFGECGSCTYSDVPYKVQVAAKLHAVKHLLSLVEQGAGQAFLADAKIKIIASPEDVYYRTRMDYAIDFNGRLGLKKKGTWHTILHGHTCILPYKTIHDVFKWLDKRLVEFGLQGFDRLQRKGELSFAVVQGSRNMAQVTFVIRSETWRAAGKQVVHKLEKLAQEMFKALGFVVAVNLAVTESRREDSNGEVIWSETNTMALDRFGLRQIYDKFVPDVSLPFIVQKFGGIKYPVPALGFFQPNIYTAGILQDVVVSGVLGAGGQGVVGHEQITHGQIAADAGNVGKDIGNEPIPGVIDLFGGVGFLTAPLALQHGFAVHVVEVGSYVDGLAKVFWELNKAKIHDGGQVLESLQQNITGTNIDPGVGVRADAGSNFAGQLHFHRQDAYELDILGLLDSTQARFLVLDPPRRGLTRRLQKRLVAAAPHLNKIIYVSCNIKQFAIEFTKRLHEAYTIKKITLIDQFAHTPHVEAVIELTPKGALH